MNRILFCQILPNFYLKNYKYSVASTNFCHNLIQDNIFDCVISLLPLKFNKVLKNENKILYFNLCKQFLTFFKYVSSLKNSNLWFYNLSLINIINIFIIFLFNKNNKIYILLLDYSPSKFKVFNIFQSWILKKVNGVITLRNFYCNTNQFILPGIINNYNINKHTSYTNKFIFSGILSKNRLPYLLFDVFKNNPNLELHITGFIDESINTNDYFILKNIHYHGFLDYKDYENLLKDVDFSLNFRDPNYTENCYNFPSKSLEHLSKNLALISTIKYDEIPGINYIYIGHNSFDIHNFFKTFEKNNYSSFFNQGEKLYNFLNITNWNNAIFTIEKNSI
jgi:hypothetical protein